jgi:hypothetical protein
MSGSGTNIQSDSTNVQQKGTNEDREHGEASSEARVSRKRSAQASG